MGISESKYKEILRSYEDKQLRHKKELSEKREALYIKLPALKGLDSELSDLSLQLARAKIYSDQGLQKEISEKKAAILSKKQLLLEENSIGGDYLEVRYDCPDCRDTGYIGSSKCHCLRKLLTRELYDQSNIHATLLKENFTFLTFEYYNDAEKAEMERIIAEAKIFIRDFDKSFTNLLFFGNVGCGKTFLSNCIAKELLDRGNSVIYFTAYQLFDLMAKNTFGKSDSIASDRSLQDIINCDLLVLDDLGSEFSNGFTISQFFMILNERLQREKSTIISTNLTPQQIYENYSERSLSRILGSYHIFHFTGRDLRSRIANT